MCKVIIVLKTLPVSHITVISSVEILENLTGFAVNFWMDWDNILIIIFIIWFL